MKRVIKLAIITVICFLVIVPLTLASPVKHFTAPLPFGYNDHLLEFTTPKGTQHCSSTAIGPDALLTATHCFPDGEYLLEVDGVLRTVQSVTEDADDHAIIILTERPFALYSVIDLTKLNVGDNISFIGNPGPFRSMFRKGYISGFVDGAVFVDVQGWHGDSGSGMYGPSGRLQCVLSASSIVINPESFGHIQFIICYKFSFDLKELDKIGVKYTR